MELVELDQGPRRNTFLTVLCILSFLGSGLGLLDAFLDFASADLAGRIVSGTLDDTREQMHDEDVPGIFDFLLGAIKKGLTPGNIRKLSIAEAVSNALTLWGAVLMWNLKKRGFWIYVSGIVVLFAAPLAIFGSGLIGIMTSGMTGFFGVIFIVLYAVNRKFLH